MSQTAFGRAMASRGFERKKISCYYYIGVTSNGDELEGVNEGTPIIRNENGNPPIIQENIQ